MAKNPWMSAYLSAYNRAVGTATGQAKAQASRNQKSVANAWFDAFTPKPAAKPKRRRKR